MPSDRKRRYAAGGVLAAGLAVAAAATGAGPFLRADRDFVGRPFQVARPLRLGSTRDGGRLPAGLQRAGDVAEIVLVVLASLVVLAMLAAVLTVFVRGLARIHLLRSRATSADEVAAYDEGELADDEGIEPLRRRLARQLALSEDELATEDPQEVVLVCYLAMVELVAASGTAPRPAETPTELLERVLTEQAVSAAAVGALTALYREARYSAHPVDETMRADARAALAGARRELAGARRERVS